MGPTKAPRCCEGVNAEWLESRRSQVEGVEVLRLLFPGQTSGGEHELWIPGDGRVSSEEVDLHDGDEFLAGDSYAMARAWGVFGEEH